jgi:hypothetical protein
VRHVVRLSFRLKTRRWMLVKSLSKAPKIRENRGRKKFVVPATNSEFQSGYCAFTRISLPRPFESGGNFQGLESFGNVEFSLIFCRSDACLSKILPCFDYQLAGRQSVGW